MSVDFPLIPPTGQTLYLHSDILPVLGRYKEAVFGSFVFYITGHNTYEFWG